MGEAVGVVLVIKCKNKPLVQFPLDPLSTDKAGGSGTGMTKGDVVDKNILIRLFISINKKTKAIFINSIVFLFYFSQYFKIY